ncbi:MAG: UbiA prenyltransferase family protein [Jatrophihabitans sp.]
MITSIRLFSQLTRPAVLLLLALFAAIGAAGSGAASNIVTLAEIYFIVATFLVFSVAANDLADVAVDRVNLPGDRRRPLVTATARQADMVLLLIGCAIACLGVAAAVNLAVLITASCGLLISAAYSLPPSRLAARGAVGSMVLPACYVATPFLVGCYAGRPALRPGDLLLLAGLYTGFIGRILLKDFRDVRDDALFGKRTFLVRHGRRATCRPSAVLWTIGTVLLIRTGRLEYASAASYAVLAVAVVVLVIMLARDGGPRRDEIIIATVAILGRGLLLTVLAYHQLATAGWAWPASTAMMLALVALTTGQAWSMYRHGPPGTAAGPADVTARRYRPECRQPGGTAGGITVVMCYCRGPTGSPVPARPRAGPTVYRCPATGETYTKTDGLLALD